MQTIRYRTVHPNLRLRRTKAEIPGWTGEAQPREDGSREQPWHCIPFTEGARCGIEVFYPFDHELRVTTRDGKPVFEGDFGPAPAPGLQWPPFRDFGGIYYTYQILLDLHVDPGWAIRTEPHPRFYTSTANDVPIAVPALLQEWWPMMSFMVFKSPLEGQTHIFRPNEPFMQIMIVPAQQDYTLAPMGFDEAAERELQGQRIHASRDTLGAASRWTSSTRTVFDGTYRHIASAAKARDRDGEA